MPGKVKAIPTVISCFLSYDPTTGEFCWKVAPSNNVYAGQDAGSIDKLGYKIIGFRGTSYKAHRVAWFLATGEQPDIMDHIDGNKANNRISNLRNVDRIENSRNRVEHRGGGSLGVHWCRRARKWVAQALQAEFGKQKWLGYFATQSDAADAVASFSRKPRKA